jgi:hypothetical protein
VNIKVSSVAICGRHIIGTGFPICHSTAAAYSFWGVNSRPVGGCSSETWSHPINMNMNLEGTELFLFAQINSNNRRFSLNFSLT